MKQGLALAFVLWTAAAPADEPPDQTIRLTVSPAAEPSPALRYPLLPELRDTSPGNAVFLYYRCFSPEWLKHRQPDVAKKLDKWRSDTSQKPSPDFKWVLSYPPLQEMDRAARRSYCDWEMTERARKEGIAMRLPEVQVMREFAGLLALRARFHMEAGEHDQVLRSLQTGLTLGRHVADAPTLIQALVGLALSNIMLEEVQHWIEKPGSPNLYWSLTNLPSPYIDLRKPFQGERLFADSLFPGIREAIRARKPEAFPLDKLQGLIREMHFLTGQSLLDDGVTSLGGKFGLALYAAKLYPEARKALRGQGWSDRDLDALPVTTAALMYEMMNYDHVYDDFVKWAALPYPQARAGFARALQNMRPRVEEVKVGTVMARLLLPAVDKVMNATVRIDRRIAVLRCVEALRLHAAAHEGQLPEKLDDITAVPVPLDPRTGKAFEYRREGDKAILHAPPFPGEQAIPIQTSIKLEITLKK